MESHPPAVTIRAVETFRLRGNILVVRRGVSVLLLMFVAFAMNTNLPLKGRCCCRTNCPMKRSAAEGCGTSCSMSTTQSSNAVWSAHSRIAPAVVAEPAGAFAPAITRLGFATRDHRARCVSPQPEIPPPRV